MANCTPKIPIVPKERSLHPLAGEHVKSRELDRFGFSVGMFMVIDMDTWLLGRREPGIRRGDENSSRL